MAPLISANLLDLQPRRQPVCRKAASGSSSSSSSSPGESPAGGSKNWLGWFDRLPSKVQLGLLGGLLFFGMFIVPFLQPTFLYGDASKSAAGQQHGITDVREAAEPVRHTLPRYIPGASELYDFLQENSMPRTLPDGRSESPGVFRIYISSMTILAVFYVFSAVVSLILRGVAGVLRAVGVMGPAPPPKPDES